MNLTLRTACFTALLLFVLPSGAKACGTAPARPVIQVEITENPARFDISRSIEQLTRMDIQTKSPYPSHYHTNVGGVMSGQLALEHSIQFRRDVAEGRVCVAIAAVKIKLSMDSTVFIARDYQKQACWFKEIFAHESSHVETDRAVLGKYRDRITDGLNMVLMTPEDYSSGWIQSAGLEQAQYDLQVGLEHTLAVLFNQMMRERGERQQAVDSRQEYSRIAGACRSS